MNCLKDLLLSAYKRAWLVMGWFCHTNVLSKNAASFGCLLSNPHGLDASTSAKIRCSSNCCGCASHHANDIN